MHRGPATCRRSIDGFKWIYGGVGIIVGGVIAIAFENSMQASLPWYGHFGLIILCYQVSMISYYVSERR